MTVRDRKWQRRDFLKYTGIASAVGLAGCTGGNGNGGSDYPSEPIKLIIPFSQGGGTDTINRQLVPVLSEKLGVNIQIENVPGAASMRGTAQALQAKPDGYTFLAFNPPSTPISYLVNQPDFELRDVMGIASYAIGPAVVTLNPDVADKHGIKSYGDLIKKYKDGTLQAFAGQSIGSYFHVMALIARKRHGLEFNPDKYIAYDGTGPAVEAVASGEAPAGLGIDTATLSFTQDDRLRVPVVLTSEGSAAYPDKPTVTDLDYENMDSVGQVTRCYWAPPETPQNVIDTLTGAVKEMINDDKIKQYAKEQGQQVSYNGPDYANNLLKDILENIPNEVDLKSIREQVNN